MNNGDKILELQCDAESIELLAAQRAMYSSAKAWDSAAMIVGLGAPIGATIIQAAIGLPFNVLVLIDLLVLILGFFIPLHSEELVKKAAGTQQAFDSKVYGVKFENCFEDQRVIRKYAARYIKENGSYESLKEWYTIPLKGRAAKDAVPECQRQNADWTAHLASRYIAFELSLMILVAAIMLLIVDVSHANAESLCFFLAPFEWIILRAIKFVRLGKLSAKVSKDIPDYELKGLQNIKRVQRRIFEYRTMPYHVPDWFYSLFKHRDNKLSA